MIKAGISNRATITHQSLLANDTGPLPRKNYSFHLHLPGLGILASDGVCPEPNEWLCFMPFPFSLEKKSKVSTKPNIISPNSELEPYMSISPYFYYLYHHTRKHGHTMSDLTSNTDKCQFFIFALPGILCGKDLLRFYFLWSFLTLLQGKMTQPHFHL